MSVYLDETSRVLIQGITGGMGRYSAEDMLAYGTQVVAGVSPGKGGETVAGVPVFNFVEEAVQVTGANTALVYAPGASGLDAVRESLDAGIRLIVYPGDGIPRQDTQIMRKRVAASDTVLIGPNTPGIITPGVAKAGFMPSPCYRPGRVGVVSKSGSLSYEICQQLTLKGLGQSTVVGVGGDPIKGLTMEQALWKFDEDDETDAILLLGEVGGMEEYGVVSYLQGGGRKPMASFLVGKSAPPGKTMGHAGALISSPREGYAEKLAALRDAGVRVTSDIEAVYESVKSVLG